MNIGSITTKDLEMVSKLSPTVQNIISAGYHFNDEQKSQLNQYNTKNGTDIPAQQAPAQQAPAQQAPAQQAPAQQAPALITKQPLKLKPAEPRKPIVSEPVTAPVVEPVKSVNKGTFTREKAIEANKVRAEKQKAAKLANETPQQRARRMLENKKLLGFDDYYRYLNG